ncbi:hypothetical protein LJC17_05185, partial [Acholeplasma sp. OttesenSCG-928-E16]|nr:hypothetical protein [Acholeplasma sp. OttesenSCG-928-E16]
MKKIVMILMLMMIPVFLYSCKEEEVKDDREFRVYVSSHGYDENGDYLNANYVINTYEEYQAYRNNHKNIYVKGVFKTYKSEDFDNMTLYVLNFYSGAISITTLKRISFDGDIANMIIYKSSVWEGYMERYSIWYEGIKKSEVTEV